MPHLTAAVRALDWNLHFKECMDLKEKRKKNDLQSIRGICTNNGAVCWDDGRTDPSLGCKSIVFEI